MKFVHFLYVFVFIILNCINTFANLNGYDLILNRIKNDTLLCINPEIYDHKQFENCMKPVPADVKDGSPLDVLCMSVYDSFLLLCEGNKNEKLKEKIPQDLKQFDSVLDSQRNQPLDTFCTTIKENKNLKTRLKSSNITNQWINLFIDFMKEKKSCFRICSNADGTVVEPLCPFVVWTNQLYSENSNPTVVPSNPAVVPRNPAIVPSNPAVVPRNPAIVPSNPAVVPSNPPAVPQQSSASKSVDEYTNIEDSDDDSQIPSDVKETLPDAPVQNKQPTFNAAHAGINAETDMEQVIVRDDPFVEAEESHFFTYFISMAVLSIVMYLVFHNKKKLAGILALEDEREWKQQALENC